MATIQNDWVAMAKKTEVCRVLSKNDTISVWWPVASN